MVPMLEFPKTDDPLVAALQRLIARQGSYAAVADAIDANDQTLYQIAQLKPHSVSKKLKSVGPSLRRRLDKVFPDWLSGVVVTEEPSTPWPAEPSQAQWPMQRFPARYWQALTHAERAIVEEAMFEAYDRLMARREQLRIERGASRKVLKPAA